MYPAAQKMRREYCFEKGILRFAANTVENQKEMRDAV